MARPYRVAIGLSAKLMELRDVDEVIKTALTDGEQETYSRVNATVVFYTNNPFGLFDRYSRFEPQDFRWINISVE